METYLALCRRYYGVSITPVSYAVNAEGARQQINGWVEEKTNEKIKDLLQPAHVSAATTLVLLNAINFKGNWASQFDTGCTEDAPFWTGTSAPVSVPIMAQTLECEYASGRGLQVLSLPYVGHEISMVILLPDSRNGLPELEAQLTTGFLARCLMGLCESSVHVCLPRLKLTGAFTLKGVLEALGMIDAFGGADFAGMTGRRDLFISDVIHKAFVEVNEEGNEAAAATAIVMSRGIAAPLPTFRADHPFLFLIRDNATGTILFLGRFVDPAMSG